MEAFQLKDERHLNQIEFLRPVGETYIRGFEIAEEELQMMTYYVFTLSPVMAEKMYRATYSVRMYSEKYWDYTFEERKRQVIPIDELPELLEFIEEEVIPILQDQVDNGNTADLLELWGVGESIELRAFLGSKDDMFYKMNELYCENIDLIPEDLMWRFQNLSTFFHHVKSERHYHIVRHVGE